MALSVVYSFPGRIGVPGIGTTAWHQVAGLVSLGAKVTLFCGSCERPIPGIHCTIETMKWGRLKIPHRVLGRLLACAIHDRQVAKRLRMAKMPYDVLHAWPLGSLETLKVAKTRGIRSFLERPNTHTRHAFEVVAKEHEKLGIPLPRGHSHAYNERALVHEEAEYAVADYLLCPSDVVAASFYERGFPKEKIKLHRYGCDTKRFKVYDDAHSRSTNVGIRAVFVGACEPRKGLHYALEAWHKSGAAKRGEFRICGTFVSEYKQVLAALIDHSSIIECGFVSNETPMYGADVLMLPSIEEGSALVTYEARACGCVLLVSDAAGAHCRHMENALVHPAGDVDKLTAQLKLLLDDAELFSKLRSASVEGIRHLSWDSAASRLYAIYQTATDLSTSVIGNIGLH